MKNIILLSDGTGNSAAKRNRTNVLRLYKALDLHRADQVAFYDDGVGSQQFLPLKILGGAFGWGFKRNVLQLYRFLCRTYEHGGENDPPDKIYLFGFSRGAFTVRVLAGMIAQCGLYTTFRNEEDLYQAAKRNYTAFRTKFKRWSDLLFKIYRWVTRATDKPLSSVKPEIEFIGVWDTVDAYGFPIDEFAILWDRLIFPIRFPDHDLSPKVNRACHALSIDDERLTFHPLLWNEGPPKKPIEGKQPDPKRIEQVWFPGVHSGVGGGYPLNNMALVSLDWMMSRVEAATVTGPGLHFIPQVRSRIEHLSDWHGKQYDSRAGLAAYYRYKPREIEKLCHDPEIGVQVKNPKIHRSVFERIRGNVFPYAPTGLPTTYQVVSTRGSTPVFEKKNEPVQRAEATKHALDAIYWRKWLYWILLATTILLLCSRTFLDASEDWVCTGRSCLCDPLLELVSRLLPGMASGWIEGLRQNPAWLWGFVAAFGVLLWLKRAAWTATKSRAIAAWANLKREDIQPPGWSPTRTSRLRRLGDTAFCHRVKKSSALVVFLIFLTLLLVLASRTNFYIMSILGKLCHGSEAAQLTIPAPSQTATLDIRNPCYPTGILLSKGQSYRFDVVHDGQDRWFDGGMMMQPARGGAIDPGFSQFLWLKMGVPLRRHLTQPWFKLMGRIDTVGNETFAIGVGLENYTAKSDGELFLYVNDGVFGLPFGRCWAWPYFWKIGENLGTASVTVTVKEAPDAGRR